MTRGQVASIVFRPRACACSWTGGRDAVGREHDDGLLGDLVELLHEHRAPRLEVGDDVLVVHDLLADVDRGAVEVEGLLDGDHRAVDAGAVSAWSGQAYALGRHAQIDAHAAESTDDAPDPRVGEGTWGRAALASAHGPGHLPDGARAGAADRPGDLAVGGPARGGVGRGADDPGQPTSRRRHRLHDPARLGCGHLGPGHLCPHPVRQPEPSAGRGGQRRHPRQARLLRQPRVALAGRPRDPHGRARRAPGPPRATATAARRRGSVRPRAQAATAVPAALRRAGHRPRLRGRARRRGERAPPVARASPSRRRTPRCRAPGRPRR